MTNFCSHRATVDSFHHLEAVLTLEWPTLLEDLTLY